MRTVLFRSLPIARELSFRTKMPEILRYHLAAFGGWKKEGDGLLGEGGLFLPGRMKIPGRPFTGPPARVFTPRGKRAVSARSRSRPGQPALPEKHRVRSVFPVRGSGRRDSWQENDPPGLMRTIYRAATFSIGKNILD